MFQYEPEGVCSVGIQFDIRDGKVRDVQFEGGCNGNLKAIAKLVDGMDAKDCVEKLKGIQCGYKKTSCGDQFAKALELAIKKQHEAA